MGAITSALGGSAMVVFAASFSSITDESRLRVKLKAPPPDHGGPEAIGPPEPGDEAEEDKIITIRVGLGSATFMAGVVCGCLIGTIMRSSENFRYYRKVW